MHSATCSIWSREMKQKVSDETGAIHTNEVLGYAKGTNGLNEVVEVLRIHVSIPHIRFSCTNRRCECSPIGIRGFSSVNRNTGNDMGNKK